MQNYARPLGAEVTITVNYGSNATCTGPGDPNEAAAWVNYANNVKHYGIKYWTVGNEQYFPEIDLDPVPYSPQTYANRVANQFYPLMKAQDPTIQVGIDMALGNATYSATSNNWDQVVLATAKYDFVEMHYYPEYNNQDDDAALLTKWADQIAANFKNARTLLAANGHPNTPIFLGEFDRDSGVPAGYGGPGHESVSIVNALFNAIVIGEVTKAGIGMATAWLGVDTCESEVTSPPASTAYGWQSFGSFGMFANTGKNSPYSCEDKGVPARTPFPKARAFQILKEYVIAGETPIAVTSSNAAVRAYAATNRGGYAFLLVNTDSSASQPISVGVTNGPAESYTATTLTYGQSQYDQSKYGIWAGPVSSALGAVGGSANISLPPWSITLVRLSRQENYEGLWWAAGGSESGWGINFAHQGDVIFATWFTYDANGKAWWLTMTANKMAEGVYSGQLIRTNGAPFSAFVPPATTTVVGTGTLTFTSATTGTFAYTVNDGANAATQTKPIVLQTFGPVPTCVWGAQPDLTQATNYQDLWYVAPAESEAGWGINFTQQGTTIFATWFTYDANRNPLWLSASLPQTGPKSYAGALLRTGGQAFSAVPFDPAKIARTQVGTATLAFTNGNAGTFAYSVDLGDGVNKATQTKAITRQVFRAPGTVCN